MPDPKIRKWTISKKRYEKGLLDRRLDILGPFVTTAHVVEAAPVADLIEQAAGALSATNDAATLAAVTDDLLNLAVELRGGDG